jgi:hypothetical protein
VWCDNWSALRAAHVSVRHYTVVPVVDQLCCQFVTTAYCVRTRDAPGAPHHKHAYATGGHLWACREHHWTVSATVTYSILLPHNDCSNALWAGCTSEQQGNGLGPFLHPVGLPIAVAGLAPPIVVSPPVCTATVSIPLACHSISIHPACISQYQSPSRLHFTVSVSIPLAYHSALCRGASGYIPQHSDPQLALRVCSNCRTRGV